MFAAAFSPRPGTPAARLADDVPPAEKRRRLNALLQLQEGIGLERNQRWQGLTTQVLVDTVTPPRVHDHEDTLAAGARARGPAARGRGRALGPQSRKPAGALLRVPESLVGRLVDVRIEHAGPYSLRGSLA